MINKIKELSDIFHDGIIQIYNLLLLSIGCLFFLYNSFDLSDYNKTSPKKINWDQYYYLNKFNKKVNFKSILYLIFIVIILYLLVNFPINLFNLIKFL